MGVICFTSLKGGVGKTTLSLNTAAALAKKGAEVLLIDLDPVAHATRFFSRDLPRSEASLAKLCLLPGVINESCLVDFAVNNKVPLLREARERLVLLPGGAELRHLVWGRGANILKHVLPKLISELKPSFDYIIFDTPPDFSILVRNAIATSDLVVVPVDGSAMSIDCLEQLSLDASHIQGPRWVIARSMVSKQALRLRDMSEKKIREHLQISDTEKDLFSSAEADGQEDNVANIKSPLYLLDTIVYRTEEQNKLTFSAKTAFESVAANKLASQYLSLANEIDAILMLSEEEDAEIENHQNSYTNEQLPKEKVEKYLRINTDKEYAREMTSSL